MKKILIIIVALLVLSALAVVGYKATYKPSPGTVKMQPAAPTPVSDDLKQQLMLTEDDGGQADFKALDQDAQGL